MHVSRFRAKTIHEAMAQVRQVLGSDALILSTRQMPSKEGRGYYEIESVPAGTDLAKFSFSNRSVDVEAEPMPIEEMIPIIGRMTDGYMETLVMHPNALNWYARMIKSGIQTVYAKKFLESRGVFEDIGSREIAAGRFSESLLQEIAKNIGIADPFAHFGDRQLAAAFIGTTGVGKTTTIAKLAARLMLSENKKVGLISIDTYRIGAIEQLKIYANILGIPCFQAFKRNDLLSALDRLEGVDVILIDTAGQSQYDLDRIRELRGMLTEDLSINCHLCLSVNTAEAEMKKTAENFAPLDYETLIFTKIDEARTCGGIINQIMKTPQPISYLTTGQNVPEDIEKAGKNLILRYVFNQK